MPTLVIELILGGVAEPESIEITNLKVDNASVTITDQDVSVVDSENATVEITYTT